MTAEWLQHQQLAEHSGMVLGTGMMDSDKEGMQAACPGNPSALQLMEEKGNPRQPPREHPWACCQASSLS